MFAKHYQIIEFVRSFRRPIRREDLIARFECSRATSFRYLRALRDVGVIDHENRPVHRSAERHQTLEHC
jgi:predicted DNA-binding transcriptional regulator YafY